MKVYFESATYDPRHMTGAVLLLDNYSTVAAVHHCIGAAKESVSAEGEESDFHTCDLV
jgi:hypothetical protein